MLDLKLLHYFVVLMEERNVSRAAARLDLTQSAMSHALTRLRALMGDPLLLKSQGRMIPTRYALELKERVHALLAHAESLVQRPAAFSPHTAAMQFDVMSAEYMEYLLAPKLIRLLNEEAPGVDVQFHAADREHAPAWFERGEIDFRLGWWPGPPQTLRFKLLFRERRVCLSRRDHPLVRPGLSSEDYIRADHIRIQSPRQGVSEHAVDRAVSSLHRRLRVALRVQSSLTLANAVAGSDVVATVPERFARSLVDKFQLQAVPVPLQNVPDVRMALYWHERTHKDPAHRWFREKLVELVRLL
ncbi:MAG: LysR family transcriptional regulator [Burkholderiales bacterium]